MGIGGEGSVGSRKGQVENIFLGEIFFEFYLVINVSYQARDKEGTLLERSYSLILLKSMDLMEG